MKLEYDITETVQAEAQDYIDKEGNPFKADVIRTDYIPTNFEATPKNYVLRENHESENTLKWLFVDQMHKDWLTELGYDNTVYYVDKETKEILKYEDDIPVDDPIFGMKDEKDNVNEI